MAHLSEIGNLGAVVQNFVSLITLSLSPHYVQVSFISTSKANTLLLFVEKCENPLHCKGFSHFSTKINSVFECKGFSHFLTNNNSVFVMQSD